MYAFQVYTRIIFIAVAFLLTAGCTATAVPPDEVAASIPTNTPEPMDTATAVPSPTATPSPTHTPVPTLTPTHTPTIEPSPTSTPTPNAQALYDTHMQEGMDYAEEGEWENAANAFKQAIAIDPDNEKISRAYNNLGLAYQNLGEWEQAIANFDQAIVLEPDDADFYANRGDIWATLNEIEKAVEDYSRAIELDPESPRYFYNRAIAYKQLGELELALADYDQTILLDPEHAYAYHNRANIYWSLGNYNQALADFDQALLLDPTDQLGFRNRGWLHLDMGDLEAAKADFQQIITLCNPVTFSVNEGPAQSISTDDYCFSAYLELAAIECDLDDAEACLEDVKTGISMDSAGAVQYLDDWIDFQPTSAFLHYAHGLAEENLNHLDTAQADYTQAIQLNRSDTLAHEYYFRRGYLQAIQGSIEAAIADWQQTIAIEPASEAAYLNLGLAYAELEEYETAVTTLQSALSQDIPQETKLEIADLLMGLAEYLAYSSENSSQAAKSVAAIQAVHTDMPEFVIPAARLNNICWYVSLWGQAEDVLFACELAVEMEPENVSYLDSRGLARALAGDFAGAIEDFQFVLAGAADGGFSKEMIAQREAWLAAMEAGNNPFTEAVLEELRTK